MIRTQTDRAWIELDMGALRRNVGALRTLLPSGCELMPAVKADAYGHGARAVAAALSAMGVRAFCVASAEEGAELREANINGEILVLGYTHPHQFPLLREYGLTQTILDGEYAAEIDAFGQPLTGHVKVDTGMHRLGEGAEHPDRIAEIFARKNLRVTGIFTHLCAAESTDEASRALTRRQADAFRGVIDYLEGLGISCGKKHLLASGGLLNYPCLGGDYARTGIALYGVLSTRKARESCPVPLQSVLSVKARVAAVREIGAGEGVGYGWKYVARRGTRIAVITAGYADGIPRSLSCGVGSVLIRGRRAPVLGSICMDQLIADISEIPGTARGDVAVLLGKSGGEEITVYDIAEQTGTITNEILSRLGPRLGVRVLT